MIKHSNKILYVGAGCHIQPVSHFKNVKEFVFIDTQPRNEFDSYTYNFSEFGYRTKFVVNLIEECRKYNFILKKSTELDKHYYKKIISWKQYFHFLLHSPPLYINPNLLVFTNNQTNQTIHYYISTNIAFNMTPCLQQDIETCDGLIVSGYHPEKELLKLFRNPITFYGYSNTYYLIDRTNFCHQEKNTIIYWMQTNPQHIKYYFKDFFMITKDNGTIMKCYDFNDFKLTIELHDINNIV
jgi:hypothetical protein